MKGYDSTFILGVISFVLIYFFTKSFESAITIAVFFWVLSLTIFLCYYFEIADDYYREVKTVRNPKGRRTTNILIEISFFPIGMVGAFAGAFLCGGLLGHNGLTAGLGGGLGGALAIKLYFKLFLKKL